LSYCFIPLAYVYEILLWSSYRAAMNRTLP
jgi:hypothetical protein